MMYKLALIATLLFPTIFYTNNSSNISTTSIVCLVGASIKAKETPIVSKYKRKDCPVCKGTGWYLSGDSIKKVPCGYCEE